MYLEISPRQSGKTHRLIQRAVRLLKMNKRILIVCLDWNSCLRIKLKVSSIYFNKNLCNLILTSYKNYKQYNPSEFDVIFYDEFDFGGTNICASNYLLRNGYYCTTPRFVRDYDYISNYKHNRLLIPDTLLELVAYKNFRYNKYIPYHDFNHKLPINYNELDGTFMSLIAEKYLGWKLKPRKKYVDFGIKL